MKLLRGLLLTGILTVFCVISASAANVGVGEVTGDQLRLRTDSSTDSKVITAAAKGDRVLVTEELDGWYAVTYKGRPGFMSADYIELVEDDEQLGYGIVFTEGSCLSLREGPDTSYTRLATIPNGTPLKLEAFTENWFKVTYKEKEGYVHSDYIAPVTEKQAKQGLVSTLGQRIVDEALKHIGKPYVWGAKGPKSFDCAGFVAYVAKKVAGIEMAGGSSTQWRTAPGTRIKSMSSLKPGDIFYICNPAYSNGYPTSHVGIYIGNGQIVHAHSDKGVRIDSIYDSSYGRYFVGAIRLG